MLDRTSFAQEPGESRTLGRTSFGSERFGRTRPGPTMGRGNDDVTTLWSVPSLIGVGAASLVLLLVGILRGDDLGDMLVNALIGVGVYIAVTVVANELLYGGQRKLQLFRG